MLVELIQHRLNDAGCGILEEDGKLGPKTYASLFRYMGARDAAPILGDAAHDRFSKYGLITALRIAHWMAQFGHESAGFRRFEEGLSYSSQRLCAVWPKRFRSIQEAVPYAHNPEVLAEKVYGGRMGNSRPGDGWKYRGRGPQLTGFDNYLACQKRTGLPLVENPDLAALPENFILIACDFWDRAKCNALADKDQLEAITIGVNGGRIGIAERRALLDRAKRVLEP